MPQGGHNKGKGQNLIWLKDRVGYDSDECLIWPFSVNYQGYGQVGYYGKVKKAHRIMCELAHGAPPTPKHVAAHSCHNGHGGCVHPKHLDWKTARQNVLERQNVPDMLWPTRQTSIPAEHIAKIIDLRGKMNQREIGKMFGISYQHVSVIQRGKLVTQ
jgi:hypothetical protein